MTPNQLAFMSFSNSSPQPPFPPLSPKETIQFHFEFKNLSQMPIQFLVIRSSEDPITDSAIEFFQGSSMAINLNKKRDNYPCLKQNNYSLFIFDAVLCAAIPAGEFTLEDQGTLSVTIEESYQVAITTLSNLRSY